jgi:hypothetical protein
MARPAPAFDASAAAQLVTFIRAGGYPLVAAAAAGVPPKVYRSWLRRGETKQAREPFRSFARDVRQAIAQGRLRAELAVFDKDPKFWLKHGPGKEAPGNPGWTGEVKPAATVQKAAVQESEAWMALSARLFQALADFPEARQAVAEVLGQKPS